MSIALIISCEYSKFPVNRLYGCFNDADRMITRFKKIDPNMKIIYMRDDLDYSKKNEYKSLLMEMLINRKDDISFEDFSSIDIDKIIDYSYITSSRMKI